MKESKRAADDFSYHILVRISQEIFNYLVAIPEYNDSGRKSFRYDVVNCS